MVAPISEERTEGDLMGDYANRVFAVVRRIPRGKVATYGQVARLAGMPRSARLVGYAMASCQDPTVPCHRVVDRFGGTKAAFDTFAPGTQRALLEAEGVAFRLDGTVNRQDN